MNYNLTSITLDGEMAEEKNYLKEIVEEVSNHSYLEENEFPKVQYVMVISAEDTSFELKVNREITVTSKVDALRKVSYAEYEGYIEEFVFTDITEGEHGFAPMFEIGWNRCAKEFCALKIMPTGGNIIGMILARGKHQLLDELDNEYIRLYPTNIQNSFLKYYVPFGMYTAAVESEGYEIGITTFYANNDKEIIIPEELKKYDVMIEYDDTATKIDDFYAEVTDGTKTYSYESISEDTVTFKLANGNYLYKASGIIPDDEDGKASIYTDGTFTVNNDDVKEIADIMRLKEINVTTPPTKTHYETGEEVDLTGMVVTATYYGAMSDGTGEKDVVLADNAYTSEVEKSKDIGEGYMITSITVTYSEQDYTGETVTETDTWELK